MGVGPTQMAAFFSALGAKAPKVETEALGSGEFDGEKLTEQAKKATVLITAIRGEKNNDEVLTVTADGSTATTKPSELPDQKKPKEGTEPGN